MTNAQAAAQPRAPRTASLTKSVTHVTSKIRALTSSISVIRAPAASGVAALSCTEPFGLGRAGVDRWRENSAAPHATAQSCVALRRDKLIV